MFEDERLYLGRGWDYDAKRSVNAVIAEQGGKFPYSNWEKMSKQQLMDFINAKIEQIGEEFILFDVKLLKKAQKAALLDLFVEDSTSEYHHIDLWEKGRRWRHQPVGYFGISEIKLVTVTDEEILTMISRVRTKNSCSKREWEAFLAKEKKENLAKPLMIGMLSERDYDYDDKKWLHTFTTFIGVVDGDIFHYYRFPKIKNNETKVDLYHSPIHKKEWKNNGKIFSTFEDLIKEYPEFECKKEEIDRLLLIRNSVRDQRASRYNRWRTCTP